MTQGMRLASPLQALRPVRNPGESITELWPVLMLWAALLLPVDVGVRRLALPLAEILAKVWAALRRRAPDAIPQQVVVERLHQAKLRVRQDGEPTRVTLSPISSGESNGSAPKAPEPTPTSAAATSKSLLESKRKRRE